MLTPAVTALYMPTAQHCISSTIQSAIIITSKTTSNMCTSNYYIPTAQAISILGCALLSGTAIPHNPLNTPPTKSIY